MKNLTFWLIMTAIGAVCGLINVWLIHSVTIAVVSVAVMLLGLLWAHQAYGEEKRREAEAEARRD